jgi:hypothetical protein
MNANGLQLALQYLYELKFRLNKGQLSRKCLITPDVESTQDSLSNPNEKNQTLIDMLFKDNSTALICP